MAEKSPEMKMISFWLNGSEVTWMSNPSVLLLDYLRKQGLKSVKDRVPRRRLWDVHRFDRRGSNYSPA